MKELSEWFGVELCRIAVIDTYFKSKSGDTQVLTFVPFMLDASTWMALYVRVLCCTNEPVRTATL